jgi:hypothetical protein
MGLIRRVRNFKSSDRTGQSKGFLSQRVGNIQSWCSDTDSEGMVGLESIAALPAGKRNIRPRRNLDWTSRRAYSKLLSFQKARCEED